VFELFRDGRVAPFLAAVDGVELPPTNFVAEDAAGRAWITVSTRKHPRSLDFRPDCASGFIVLADAKGARIVADSANEAIVSLTAVYVNETFGRRLSACRSGRRALGRRRSSRPRQGTYLTGLAPGHV
jgi:hypothetical protein